MRSAAAGKCALIAGAGGLVGGECLAALLASGRYRKIVAPVRRALSRADERLTELIVDFNRLSDQDLAAYHIDEVFCCLGTTMRKAGSRQAFREIDYDLTLWLARAARERGATRLALVSSVGADQHARSFYLRVKGELEAAVAQLGFDSVIIVRPSLLLGQRTELRPAEALGRAFVRAISPLLRGRLRKYRPVDARVVARAMVEAVNRVSRGLLALESDELEDLAALMPGAAEPAR